MAKPPAADPRYRYERKFYVDGLDVPRAEEVIRHHPALFRPLYAPRFINNVYLDSEMRHAAVDNVEGVADRCKVRLRWYGELFGPSAATLEVKIKRGFVGRKESVGLGVRDVTPSLSAKDVRAWLASVELPEKVAELVAPLRAVLVNRYRRRYYRTADGRFRLTLDDAQEFYGFPAGRLSRVAHRDRAGIVVELKYALEDDVAADRVTSLFPFRLTRSSKYVAGLSRVE
jgi:hypothetical protein